MVPSPAAPSHPGGKEGLSACEMLDLCSLMPAVCLRLNRVTHFRCSLCLVTDQCSLTFDPRTANGNLCLSQENCRAEHLTSGPRPVPPHDARFDHTWQVLCFQGFTQGQHYWELEVSKPWAYLGVNIHHCRFIHPH